MPDCAKKHVAASIDTTSLDGGNHQISTETRNRQHEVDGSKAFVETLFLCREYGVEAVTNAVRDALRFEEVSVGLVRFHLWREIEEKQEGPRVIDYPGPKVMQGRASDYDGLTTSEEVCRG